MANTTTLKKPEDFFTSPKESTMMKEAKEQIALSEVGVLDRDQLREQENWSYLANKIFGAENVLEEAKNSAKIKGEDW